MTALTEHRREWIARRFDEIGCSERFRLTSIIDSEHVTITCKDCGNEFTRHTTFLNKSKNHNIECRSCGTHADGSRTPPLSENTRGMDESVVVDYYMRGFSATQTAKKFHMNMRRVRRIIDEAGVSRDNQLAFVIDDYPATMTGDPFLDEEFECEKCGRTFTRQQYAEKTGMKRRVVKPPRFCSKECRTSYYNSRRSTNRRLRRETAKRSTISLCELYKRDNGVCQICGGKTDPQDGYFDGSGSFHVGNLYPSIDHIVPLSKGGMDEWDNVQLVHFICNSKKGNRLESGEGEM